MIHKDNVYMRHVLLVLTIPLPPVLTIPLPPVLTISLLPVLTICLPPVRTSLWGTKSPHTYLEQYKTLMR
jgi:hypothetical protein